MKTQIILKTKQYTGSFETVAKGFRKEYGENLLEDLKKDEISIGHMIQGYIRRGKKDLVKIKFGEEVYLEAEGFVTINAKKIVEKNQTYGFLDLLLEKDEDENTVQKYIFDCEIDDERGDIKLLANGAKEVLKKWIL